MIVHVSSRIATGKGENSFAYSVSKLGVVRLVEAAAAEGRQLGVRVNCILPSIIDTPANRAALPRAQHDRWPKPAELAAVLAFLVSDDAALISGAAIPVYGRACEHLRGQVPTRKPAIRGYPARSSGGGRSVVRGFDSLAELGGPAPRLDHPAFRPMLEPPGPAERPQPA